MYEKKSKLGILLFVPGTGVEPVQPLRVTGFYPDSYRGHHLATPIIMEAIL
jgi:hypothetical protein